MPDQVAQFLSEAQAIGTPSPDLNLPKVPFQSNLKLTAEQEKRLIEHAFKRYRTLANESGRDQTMSPTWWMNSSAAANVALAGQGLLQAGDTFMGKRSRFDATFLNDVSWRPYVMGPDTIFNSSNIAVPVVRRVCRQMIARAKEALIGTDPWFSCNPSPVPDYDPVDDAGIAERIERFTRFKLKEAGSKDDMGHAISRALILGECAVKTSYVVRDQIFNTEARVLTDLAGQPVRAADGNHITESDEFIDAEDGTGRMVLKRDGVTEQPLAPIFQNVPLNRRQVLFEGPRSEVIFFKDFLCPLTATDVQTADCVIHLYDKPVAEFVDLVVKRGMVGDDTDERIGAAQKMVATIKNLSDNSPMPKAAVTQTLRPNDQFQSAPMTETGGPISEMAEFYLWFDANEDGVAENIMLIADRNTQTPIFYDHVANVTTDGLRPVEIVRINPCEGRWYGLGIMELFSSYQDFLDLAYNRWNFSQSRAGRVDFWNPTNTLEGERDPNLKMNWGSSYSLRAGMKAEDTLKPIYLTDIKFADIKAMIDQFMQLLYNESGVLTANDGEAAGLASADLATGVIEAQQSGDELFKPIIQDLKGPLERILNREIDVTLANMNPVECYSYLQGNTLGVDKITPEEVRGLKMKVEITLTIQKDQQKIQVSAAAAALVEKFYMLSPAVQAKVVTFYRSQLRSLDPSCDVMTVISPMPPLEPSPEPTKTGFNVAAKLEMLNPMERAAVMEKMGITETPAQAALSPKPEAKEEPSDVGSSAKLGEGAPNTPLIAQLTQRENRKPGK